MESKFINKQTLEFLKSKEGSTLGQQLQNIKERIDMEVNYLGLQVDELRRDFNYKHDSGIKSFESHYAEIAKLNAYVKGLKLDSSILKERLRKTKNLSIAVLAGVVTWLIMLSI